MKARYVNSRRGDEAVAQVITWLVRQGYEAYVPFGPHATADVVAVRRRSIRLFEVKRAGLTRAGAVRTGHRRLRQRQVALGVELLYVTPEGAVVQAPNAVRKDRS